TGETPLTQLAHHGQHKLCKLLLDYGADPNFKNATGKSPLFLACWNGHHSTVRVLIDYKAQNVDIQNTKGETAMHFAALTGSPEAIRYLARRGASVNRSTPKRMTPLAYA
ncbi:ankyrin, partial [Wilcoxina mikolae CBS 423.85]